MRFELGEPFSIICHPDDLERETEGFDSLGNHIFLQERTLVFDPIPSNLPEADVLGLICLITFYPFLKFSTRIIFPQPVSSSIWKPILNTHGLTTNCNYHLIKKPVEKPRNQPPNLALSWGGGLDSWAAYLLQPDLYQVLIHEHQPESPLPRSNPNYPSIVKVIKTNLRRIAGCKNINHQPPGWTIWIAVLVSSLLFSADYCLTGVALGGNLGSFFLQNGQRYHPSHLRPNFWLDTFQRVGLPIYLPLAGLTDLGVIKILKSVPTSSYSQRSLFKMIKYCWQSDSEGNNCGKCQKCVRKQSLLGRYSPGPNYQSLTGPSFDYIRTRNQKLAQWIDKYYQPALELIPDNLNQSDLIDSLSYYGIDLLPNDLNYLVEHYGWELD